MSSKGAENPLSSRDLLKMKMVSDPRLSPDGRTVAWVRTWVDAPANEYRSQICLTDLRSGETAEFTSGRNSVTHPRWSPDGRFLAFLAAPQSTEQQETQGPGLPRGYAVGGGGKQLHIRKVDAREASARCLTDVRGGVQEPRWSPAGDRLLFTAYVHPERGLETNAELPFDPEEPYERYNSDVLVTQNAGWKFDGIGYLGDYRRQVAVVEFAADSDGLGSTTLLTQGSYDLRGPRWSPDGRQVAVVGNTHPRADFRRESFVYLLDPAAGGPQEPEELFGLQEMRHDHLCWSPDGKTLALTGHDDPELGHYGNQHLWLVDVEEGTGACVTEGFDRTLGNAAVGDVRGYSAGESLCWEASGESVLALVSDEGRVHVHRIDRDGSFEALTRGDRVIMGFSCSEKADRMVVLMTELTEPGDLYEVRREGLVQLTNEHAELLEDRIVEPEHFQFETEGVELDAWVIAPPHVEKGAKYPVVLYTGGGPGGMRGFEFFFEYQLLAASGYAVVYCNTRGCQGYGEDFCTAILGCWGQADYRDNLAALDEALDRYEFLDSQRQGIAGGSYGGYQVNWALGHTERFEAAVSDRSVFNRYSSYGTSDIGHIREFEFGDGPPWETTEEYLSQSPMQFLAGAVTPTLVVHSGLDHRCPVEQGEQLFKALQRLGVPSEFVRFPYESHGLSRGGEPWHRVFRLDCYTSWFDRWLGS
jgi:dipeptidyl aminopeptidase/acylaminoacyl peptidase